MPREPAGLEMAGAVSYHYDQFPPTLSDLGTLIRPLSSAAAALARYDQMLRGMHDSGILLAPLRSQEAVVSSRMEGTISTLDEVLRYEADQEDEENPRTDRYRSEAIEVYLYSRALRAAQAAVKDGAPVSAWMIRAAHRELLSFGRGAAMSPGEFRTEQNFLVDGLRRRVLFIPISPERLNDGLEKLFAFINNDDWEILIRTALAHLEFEALHPFKDGNGRIGRMLIPLMLWKSRAITEPYLYISQYLEERRDEYIDRLREVSASGAWTAWVIFFLQALEAQATQNLQKAEEIRALYATMKDNFRKELSSQWSTQALDFMFTRPIFRNNVFTAKAGIPPATAHRFTRSLTDASLLKTLVPAAGRRPALYAFEPLLAIVRG